ncbi:YdcF family protein [Streptomonospora sp. PA3]|uniref:YdcF family protein n=1 Tax=Streptomonospora sp. PA3 TaxID=2607326 RepID=UPI0013080900|nr:YdcF family protein [Streptomonospora sp. PA3]
MPEAGEDRGDAAWPREAAGHPAEATRVFTRGVAADRTQPLSRDGAPGGTRPAEPGGDPAPWPRAGAAEDAGGERTRVMRRPAAAPEPAAEPEGRGPRGGRAARPAPRRRRRFRLRWIVAAVLLLALATPPGTWAWVWYTARADERPPSDAILVLGASQYNGRPSPVFEARLAHAHELYREGVAPVLVTVGGNQPGDNYTEGGSGRDWLVEHGVPAGDVVAIEEGDDTLQSIRAVQDVYDRRGWSGMVIVTDPWHSLRSRLMAEDHGMEAATSPSRSGPAVIERETQLWYITRETASLWYYWIFGDSSDIEVTAA